MKINIPSFIASIVVFATVMLIGSTRSINAVVFQENPTAQGRAQLVAQVTDDPYAAQVNEGLSYFRSLVEDQISLVEELQVALASENLAAAEVAYVNARPPYEQIEVFAGSFEREDSDIDARPYTFGEGELSPDFRGFHRIEHLLYRDGDIAAAIPYAEELKNSVLSLQAKLNDPSNFNSSMNFEGMIALATEVPAKKISSEEETWSDQSILIFRENWNGIYSQYKPFAASLDEDIAAKVDAAYKACQASIAPFVREGFAAALPYSHVTTSQRDEIVQAGYQLRDAIIEARDTLSIS